MALTLPKSEVRGPTPPAPFMPPVLEKEVAFILDKSGSMSTQREQVISAVNEFIGDLQRAKEIVVKFTLTLFDTQVTVPMDGVLAPEVKPLTIGTYIPAGNTALYDALGQTLNALERRLAGKEGTAIVVCILTDGQENSSKEFDEKQIREKIEALNQRPNWTFTFMGADQDAWIAAGRISIPVGNTMSYDRVATAEALSSNSQNVVKHLMSNRMKENDIYRGATDLRKKKAKK